MAEKINLNALNEKFANLQQNLRAQFSNLDPRNPVSWPALPRYSLFAGVALAVVAVLWFLWLSGQNDQLAAAHDQEAKLRDEYKIKLGKAINLEALRKQREQVLQYVTQLEKQLPSKAEMDALLSDINQAGLGRSLQHAVHGRRGQDLPLP